MWQRRSTRRLSSLPKSLGVHLRDKYFRSADAARLRKKSRRLHAILCSDQWLIMNVAWTLNTFRHSAFKRCVQVMHRVGWVSLAKFAPSRLMILTRSAVKRANSRKSFHRRLCPDPRKSFCGCWAFMKINVTAEEYLRSKLRYYALFALLGWKTFAGWRSLQKTLPPIKKRTGKAVTLL